MKRPLTVLHIVDGFRHGGAESKLLELLAKLDRSRFRVVLCSLTNEGTLRSEFEALGFPVLVFHRRFPFDPIPFIRLFRYIRFLKPDVVQTTLFYADFAGVLTARAAGVRAFISWETVSHDPGNRFHAKPQRRIGYRWAMKYVSRIAAVSDQVRDSIVEYRHVPANKIETVHYGVDLTRYRVSRIPDLRVRLGIGPGPVIGVVARLEEVKGHVDLLEALAGLVPVHPDLICLLVGDGVHRPVIEARTRELGLESRVRFLGLRRDIPELVSLFDVFVLPSHFEGLPNSILEAMACAKPVVATRVGGIPEAVRHEASGLLVPPRDSAALSIAIGRLLDNPSLRVRFGREGRRLAETRFSLDHQIGRFEALYEQLAGKDQR
jgi:glycosyltransferase involved in cell wall biosynthesis